MWWQNDYSWKLSFKFFVAADNLSSWVIFVWLLLSWKLEEVLFGPYEKFLDAQWFRQLFRIVLGFSLNSLKLEVLLRSTSRNCNYHCDQNIFSQRNAFHFHCECSELIWDEISPHFYWFPTDYLLIKCLWLWIVHTCIWNCMTYGTNNLTGPY